jgi:hypothetical protein
MRLGFKHTATLFSAAAFATAIGAAPVAAAGRATRNSHTSLNSHAINKVLRCMYAMSPATSR